MKAELFVVRCGHRGMYVGQGNRRVSTADRALRFQTPFGAEDLIRDLQLEDGVFPLPWLVETVLVDIACEAGPATGREDAHV